MKGIRSLQHTFLRCGLLLLLACISRSTASSSSEATEKGRKFLVVLLNTNLDLLPEYRGAKVYWVFHDNYLAAKVLDSSRPEISKRIGAAMDREGIRKSGKIELLFGEAERPLPFRQFQLKDVRRVDDKLIRTEVVTDRVLEGWQEYADLLLLACIAERDQPAAQRYWEAAMRLWDGKGFLDAAAKHYQRYSTYKLGLSLIAARRFSPPCTPPEGLIAKLLSLQDDSGGWITDYDAGGKRIGVANVETTCLAILGLEESLFQDDFKGKLGEGWGWRREHREAWRVSERGLEVRIEPGNMWGPQNNARNVLVRPAPDPGPGEIEVGVNVENKPTNQYEQVDLVWYYDDSNMVKLGLELVDGKLSVVMGREESDKTRTIAIVPVESTSLRLQLFVRKDQIRGRFRITEAQGWYEVGECSLPTSVNQKARISLQFYQGPEKVEHWARVTQFQVVRFH
jgi:regulation of enolase protein 1 (concanavalin A-like superfamily)